MGLSLAADGLFSLFFPKKILNILNKLEEEGLEMFDDVKPSTLRLIAVVEAVCGLWLMVLFAVGRGWIVLWR